MAVLSSCVHDSNSDVVSGAKFRAETAEVSLSRAEYMSPH